MPAGDERVYRKVQGWDDSYLGRLYDPSSYHGGHAIHGATGVPQPARPVTAACGCRSARTGVLPANAGG